MGEILSHSQAILHRFTLTLSFIFRSQLAIGPVCVCADVLAHGLSQKAP